MGIPGDATTELLPIVADTPSKRPAMGFEAYASAIAAAIRGGTPPQFTVGIYGAWGSGKSSLLNAIQAELRKDVRILAVPFDAWRYERADHIIVPLLNAIHIAIPELEDPGLTKKVRKALGSVARSISFSLGPITVDPKAALENESIDTAYAEILDAAYARPYADMRAIGESLGTRRIVLLVDDLDRCSPDKVVSLLEAINLVMDVPGFVFVLALDYDVLVRAVTAKYPYASGHVFIEKMVQVPFRVPRLDMRPELFLQDLIPDWNPDSSVLPVDFTSIAFDVATLGLAANPRQVKRFINSLLLLLRIASYRGIHHDPRLVAGLVGLQLRWPAEYQDLADSVYSDDQDPLGNVTSAEQVDLIKYGRAFFDPHPSIDELRALLQLTESVAQPEAYSGFETGEYDSGLPRAEELREEAVGDIRAALAAQSFHESRRAAGIYNHPEMDDYRVKIGKAVIRFEGKDPSGRWLLAESMYLTRARTEAVALINDLDALRARVDAGILRGYGQERLPRSGE